MQVLRYPSRTARAAFESTLEFASKEGMNLVLRLVPTSQLYLLAMVFLYRSGLSSLQPGFIWYETFFYGRYAVGSWFYLSYFVMFITFFSINKFITTIDKSYTYFIFNLTLLNYIFAVICQLRKHHHLQTLSTSPFCGLPADFFPPPLTHAVDGIN